MRPGGTAWTLALCMDRPEPAFIGIEAPAMLIAVPYLLIASTLAAAVADGGPGWMNILVMLSLWNAAKFAFIGPVSLILLAGTRLHEARAYRVYPRYPVA